jgi:hypothetical protein
MYVVVSSGQQQQHVIQPSPQFHPPARPPIALQAMRATIGLCP